MMSLNSNIGQSDLFLVYDQGSLVGLCMQEYKLTCADTQTGFDQLI